MKANSTCIKVRKAFAMVCLGYLFLIWMKSKYSFDAVNSTAMVVYEADRTRLILED